MSDYTPAVQAYLDYMDAKDKIRVWMKTADPQTPIPLELRARLAAAQAAYEAAKKQEAKP